MQKISTGLFTSMAKIENDTGSGFEKRLCSKGFEKEFN